MTPRALSTILTRLVLLVFIGSFLPRAGGITSEDFILLHFPKDTMDKECVWLLGNYCEVVNRTVIGKKRMLRADQLAGTLRARLQALKSRAVIQPSLFNL